MEAAAAAAAGAVARRGPFCPADAGPFRRFVGAARCAGSGRVSVRRPGGFADEGHLRFYAPSARCGGREEEKRVAKTRAKLVKELAVFQAAAAAAAAAAGGLSVEGAAPGEAGERRITLEEAADVLLAHLELMRAEEKEMKRRKEEKKAAMRAAARQKGGCDDDSEDEQEGKERSGKMRDCDGRKNSADHKEMKKKNQDEKAATLKAACKKKMKDCDASESSSSSSESSDSDCEEEVIDMDSVRAVLPANAEPVVPEDVQMGITAKEEEFSSPAAVSRSEEGAMVDVAQMLVGSSASTSVCCSSGKVSVPAMAAEAAAAAAARDGRIEVCMGGKCKRAGAAELKQAFEGRMGVGGGAVVGCKCMGKCREGPNVRIRNVQEGDEGDESMMAVRNPLCLGVGLDDVGAIVAKFFGEEMQVKDDVGLLAA